MLFGGTPENSYQAAAQCKQYNPAPQPIGPSVSAIISEFEAIHGRVSNYAEYFHKIADKLTGPAAPPRSECAKTKDLESAGNLNRLYAIRAMIDLKLDSLNEAMHRLDQAV